MHPEWFEIRNLILQCWLLLKRLIHTRTWFYCLSSNFYEDSQNVWNNKLCKVLAQNPVKTLWPSLWMAFNCLNATEEGVYFLRLSSQIFPVLIWSTSKGWKSESTFGVTEWFWTRYRWIGNLAPWESSANKYEQAINIYQELTDRHS